MQLPAALRWKALLSLGRECERTLAREPDGAQNVDDEIAGGLW